MDFQTNSVFDTQGLSDQREGIPSFNSFETNSKMENTTSSAITGDEQKLPNGVQKGRPYLIQAGVRSGISAAAQERLYEEAQLRIAQGVDQVEDPRVNLLIDLQYCKDEVEAMNASQRVYAHTINAKMGALMELVKSTNFEGDVDTRHVRTFKAAAAVAMSLRNSGALTKRMKARLRADMEGAITAILEGKPSGQAQMEKDPLFKAVNAADQQPSSEDEKENSSAAAQGGYLSRQQEDGEEDKYDERGFDPERDMLKGLTNKPKGSSILASFKAFVDVIKRKARQLFDLVARMCSFSEAIESLLDKFRKDWLTPANCFYAGVMCVIILCVCQAQGFFGDVNVVGILSSLVGTAFLTMVIYDWFFQRGHGAATYVFRPMGIAQANGSDFSVLVKGLSLVSAVYAYGDEGFTLNTLAKIGKKVSETVRASDTGVSVIETLFKKLPTAVQLAMKQKFGFEDDMWNGTTKYHVCRAMSILADYRTGMSDGEIPHPIVLRNGVESFEHLIGVRQNLLRLNEISTPQYRALCLIIKDFEKDLHAIKRQSETSDEIKPWNVYFYGVSQIGKTVNAVDIVDDAISERGAPSCVDSGQLASIDLTGKHFDDVKSNTKIILIDELGAVPYDKCAEMLVSVMKISTGGRVMIPKAGLEDKGMLRNQEVIVACSNLEWGHNVSCFQHQQAWWNRWIGVHVTQISEMPKVYDPLASHLRFSVVDRERSQLDHKPIFLRILVGNELKTELTRAELTWYLQRIHFKRLADCYVKTKTKQILRGFKIDWEDPESTNEVITELAEYQRGWSNILGSEKSILGRIAYKSRVGVNPNDRGISRDIYRRIMDMESDDSLHPVDDLEIDDDDEPPVKEEVNGNCFGELEEQRVTIASMSFDSDYDDILGRHPITRRVLDFMAGPVFKMLQVVVPIFVAYKLAPEKSQRVVEKVKEAKEIAADYIGTKARQAGARVDRALGGVSEPIGRSVLKFRIIKLKSNIAGLETALQELEQTGVTVETDDHASAIIEMLSEKRETLEALEKRWLEQLRALGERTEEEEAQSLRDPKMSARLNVRGYGLAQSKNSLFLPHCTKVSYCGQTVNGFILGHNAIITVGHVFKTSRGRIREGEAFTVSTMEEGTITKRFHKNDFSFFSNGAGADDLVVFRVVGLRPRRSRLKSFWTEEEMPLLGESYMVGYEPGELKPDTRHSGKIAFRKKDYEYDAGYAGVVKLDAYFAYEKQAEGLCGSMICVCHPTNGPMILGMHVAGEERYGCGIAIPLFREQIDSLMRTAGMISDSTWSFEDCLPDLEYGKANMEIKGALAVANAPDCPNEMGQVRLSKTFLNVKELNDFRVKYAPAPIAPGRDPLGRQPVAMVAEHVSEIMSKDPLWSPSVSRAANGYLARQMVMGIQSSSLHFPLIMADDYEQWNGGGRFECLAPMDATTSAGFIESKKFGTKDKRGLFTGELGSRKSLPLFQEQVNHKLDGLRCAVPYALSPAKVFGKDELRKVEYYYKDGITKSVQEQLLDFDPQFKPVTRLPRSIWLVGALNVCVSKSLFAFLYQIVVTLSTEIGWITGINMFGPDYQKLADKAQAVSNEGFGTDMKSCFAYHNNEAVHAFADFVMEIAEFARSSFGAQLYPGWTFSDWKKAARNMLVEESSQPFFLGSNLYYLTSGLMSGSFLTTLRNTWMTKHCFTCYYLTVTMYSTDSQKRALGSFTVYNSKTYVAAQGDDNDISVHKDLQDLITQAGFMAVANNHGFELTTTDKKSVGSVRHQEHTSRFFLSVKPVFRADKLAPGNFVFAWIEDKSFLKGLAYYRKIGDGLISITLNINCQFRMLACSGPERYAKYRDLVVAGLRGVPAPIPTYHDLMSGYNRHVLANMAVAPDVFHEQAESLSYFLSQLAPRVNRKLVIEAMARRFGQLSPQVLQESYDKASRAHFLNAMRPYYERWAKDNWPMVFDERVQVPSMVGALKKEHPRLIAVAQMEIGETGATEPAEMSEGAENTTAGPVSVVGQESASIDMEMSVSMLMKRGFQIYDGTSLNANYRMVDLVTGNSFTSGGVLPWLSRFCRVWRGDLIVQAFGFSSAKTTFIKDPNVDTTAVLADYFTEGPSPQKGFVPNNVGANPASETVDKLPWQNIYSWNLVPIVEYEDVSTDPVRYDSGIYSISSAGSGRIDITPADNFQLGVMYWIPPMKKVATLYPGISGEPVELPRTLTLNDDRTAERPNAWWNTGKLIASASVVNVEGEATIPGFFTVSTVSIDLSKLEVADLRLLGFPIIPGQTPVFTLPESIVPANLTDWLSTAYPLRPVPSADQSDVPANLWKKRPIGNIAQLPIPDNPIAVTAADGWEAQDEAWTDGRMWFSLGVGQFFIVPNPSQTSQPFLRTRVPRVSGGTSFSLFSADLEAFLVSEEALKQGHDRVEAKAQMMTESKDDHASSSAQNGGRPGEQGVNFTEPLTAKSTERGQEAVDTTGIGSPGFEEMSSRPQFITAFEWTPGDVNDSIIQTLELPFDLLVTKIISAGFENNTYASWKFVRWIINMQGSLFLQGWLRAFFAPLMNAATARAVYTNLGSATVVQGIDMRPGGSNTYEIDIAWEYLKPYIDVRRGADEVPFGTMVFYVASGLKTGAGATDTNVNVTVSASIHGGRFQLPQYRPLPQTLQPDFVQNRIATEGRAGSAARRRVVEGKAQGLNDWIRGLFGGATVDFSAGPIKAGLKLDKPVIGMQPQRLTIQGRQYNAQGINPMFANVMAHTTGAENLPAHGVPRPLTSLRQMLCKPTYLDRFTVTSTSFVGEVLWRFAMGPMSQMTRVGVDEQFIPTLADLAAIMFTKWQGSLKLIFVAVGSRQTVSLAGIPNFNSATEAPGMEEAMSQYATVMRFSEAMQRSEVTVPFLSDTETKYVAKGAMKNFTDFYLGTFEVRVFGRMQSPEVCANSVEVLVYFCMGDDVKVYDVSTGPGDLSSIDMDITRRGVRMGGSVPSHSRR